MKKTFCIVTIILIVGAFGCNKKRLSYNPQLDVEQQGANEKTEVKHKEIISQKGNFLIEDSKENLISIQLPEAYKDDQETEQFIEEFILSKIKTFTTHDFKPIQANEMGIDFDKEYSNYRIQIESEIKLKSDTLVSIVFYGMINKWDTAHPNHVFFSLNFHPDTYEIVKFEDKYEINEESYNLFRKKLDERMSDLCGDSWADMRDDFLNFWFSEETFKREFKNENNSCAYYTETTLGLSLEVNFAIGGHIEFEVPYEEMEQFYVEK